MEKIYEKFINDICKKCINKYKGLCYIKKNESQEAQCVYYKEGVGDGKMGRGKR